jgi:acyl transferase domain-containing protein/SAM-dependent methyltransferase
MISDNGAELSPIKRALLELRALRAKLDAAERARAEPIAIVGMGCRLPGGANDPDSLWQLLRDGVDAIREVPAGRWPIDAYFDADPTAPGKMSTRWGGFIDGIDRFDPRVFGITGREAEAMDPQQRLLLEVAWEALEHAGQAPDRLVGSATGVFVGISSFDYGHLALSVPEEALDGYMAQGMAHSAASGRLAYALGLQGPAISLDTACSSSLIAVHLAVQSLRRGECRMALAGGVNAILVPEILIGFSRAQMMSADGRCKTFDARADGFVRGEGAGVLVLKRLSDARADGNEIWATIRGSASNQDGRSSGMTAPNGVAQEAVIRAALADAGIAPHQVGYVEAHGTGTALGDPIEVQALGAALGQGRGADRPLLIGSLKTNLGHLEAAAGVASLIKTALALHHGEVPPSLHFREPNPFIPWARLPVAVAAERTAFPEVDGRRVAGVSSFGFTGTNAHVVVEEAPSRETGTGNREQGTASEGPQLNREQGSSSIHDSQFTIHNSAAPRPLHLLKLSARGAAALDAMAERWAGFLDASAEQFADVCHAANVGRADLPDRLAVVAATAAEARGKLRAHSRADEAPGLFRTGEAGSGARQVAFLFSGHGGQYPGMGRQLWETEPVFREALEECDRLLRPHLARPLLEVLYPPAGVAADAETLLLDGMTYSQPALFAVEYALARLWISWGVRPTLLLGHSVGEYAAAVIADVFSLADGLELVAARGRLMDALPERGAMLAVFAPEAGVADLLAASEPEVGVAAMNGPNDTVLSGGAAAIERVAEALAERGIEFRRLAVAQAGHSHLLDPILDEFESVAATVSFGQPEIALVSCTTGELASAAELADPAYWRRHLRQTVRFAGGIRTLHREGCEVFLEIGPHASLAGIGSRWADGEDRGAGSEGEEGGSILHSAARFPHALWVPSLRRDRGACEQVLESLAALYVHGVDVDWTAFEARGGASKPRRVRVPTYAWQHRRYWLEHDAGRGRRILPLPAAAAWAAVREAGEHQERQGPLDLDLPRFPARWHAFERLSTAMIAATLCGLGAGDPRGADDAGALCRELGVLPRYERLVARWLHRLRDAGADADLPLPDAWRRAEEAAGDWPFMLDYLRRCGELLPAILTGTQNPLETIFPLGSFETADQLYRDSVLPRYFNSLAGAVVAGLVQARPGDRLRALEVGAGTGGTTATLAPIVDRAGGSYLFTDVSDAFLARAAERFGKYGCMSYGLLDVDADPRQQGYAPGSFDVIVGSNVLHTVADIPATLEHLRSLLAPGGLLLLIEVTRYLDWFDVSTALLEGWDRQGDPLRGEHPMLPAPVWEQALRGAGYAEVVAFPSAGSPAEVMGQHLLVAQAPSGAAAAADGAAAAPGARSGAVARREQAKREAADALAARVAAAPPHEREDLLVEYVRQHIAALLRLDSAQHVQRRSRLMELGLDSLMAVELRGRLGGGLTLPEPLPATLIFDFPTVDDIVALLLRLLAPPAEAPAPPAVPVPRIVGSPSEAEIEGLSDDEVEARLLARLAAIEDRVR